MTRRFEGRVAIVTGAARGIGAGIAEQFLAEGASVVFGDMLREEGEARVAALGVPERALFFPVDVSNEEQVGALVDFAVTKFGRLDIAVQNAGIFPLQSIERMPVQDWDRVLAVNLRSAFLVARAALGPMRRQNYGRIVLTSSITGPRVANPGLAHYAASKAGINGFIRSAALEFAGYGITVNGVEPGNIASEGLADREPELIQAMLDAIPLARLGTADDVANAVSFLADERSGYITGTTIVVDGGQLLPEGADFSMAAFETTK